MSRRRSRVSRILMGVMALTVGVGATVYFMRDSGSPQEAKASPSTKPVATPAVAPKVTAPDPAEAGALVTSAPVAGTTGGTTLMATDSPAASNPPAAAGAGPTTGPVVTIDVSGGAGGAGATTAPSTSAVARAAVVADGPVVLPAGAAAVLAEGKGKIDGGDLVAGRKVLNDALLSGSLGPADVSLAKRLISETSKQIVFSPRRFAGDPWQGTHTVQAGEVLQKIAVGEGVTWEYLCRINGLSDPRRMRANATLKTIQGPFHAVVSKGAYAMDIYLGSAGKAGSMYVTTLPVGLGANDSTPTGTWVATGKLKNPAYFSPRGEGVVAADDPKNPLGEFWIGLQGVDGQAVGKMSYGIHGTIEPETIGTQASLGCIRLRAEDIALVYELLVEGKSTVVVTE